MPSFNFLTFDCCYRHGELLPEGLHGVRYIRNLTWQLHERYANMTWREIMKITVVCFVFCFFIFNPTL